MNDTHPPGPVLHAALLAPIDPAQPSGVPLRYDPVYREIEAARRADDANLPHGIWEQPVKRAEWVQVERLCREALHTRSKDLQLAAWLAEAWVHLRGMQGLTDGAHLVRGLVERFWDDLHPQMEDGDIEYRQAPCDWFARNLHLALPAVPLAAGRSASGQAYTLGLWEAVLRAELHAAQAAKGMRGRDKGPPPPEQVTRAQFAAAAAATPAAFYHELQADLADAVYALEQLYAVLHGRMGDAAPNFGAIGERLMLCEAALSELGGVSPPSQDDLEEEEAEMAEAETDNTADQGGRRGGIRSRDEAYRMLDEAAEYLLRTEPHSPAPYLVKRAVSWGEMPLAELLQELLDSESDLKQIYRLLGTSGR